jgi:hypothetical protein
LNTNVKNADIKWNFWKKAAVRANILARNVEVRICKRCFQDFPLGKVIKPAVPAQPVHVPYLRKDTL